METIHVFYRCASCATAVLMLLDGLPAAEVGPTKLDCPRCGKPVEKVVFANPYAITFTLTAEDYLDPVSEEGVS